MLQKKLNALIPNEESSLSSCETILHCLIWLPYHILSRFLRKSGFCIMWNKGADQLRGNCTADQHLWFCYISSTVRNFKPLAIFCCTAWFVSDVFWTCKDMFSHDVTHILYRGPSPTIYILYRIQRSYYITAVRFYSNTVFLLYNCRTNLYAF